MLSNNYDENHKSINPDLIGKRETVNGEPNNLSRHFKLQIVGISYESKKKNQGFSSKTRPGWP